MEPIMRVFSRCIARNNLLSSCVLEMFERLRKDSGLHKALIEHLCTRHADVLRACDVGCVKQLMERYEQQCEHSGSSGSLGDSNSAGGGRPAVLAAPKVARTSLHRQGRDIGDDDEGYFDRDTEEDSGACSPVPWRVQHARPHAPRCSRARVSRRLRRRTRGVKGACL
jgi:hypothetical protein